MASPHLAPCTLRGCMALSARSRKRWRALFEVPFGYPTHPSGGSSQESLERSLQVQSRSRRSIQPALRRTRASLEGSLVRLKKGEPAFSYEACQENL
jgi:hypothetical protein